jgi:hypothetical protein
MASFDEIPNIQKNSKFPVGDCFEKSTLQNADKWFDDITDMSHKAFMNYFESHSPSRHITDAVNKKTMLAATGLCHSWDYAYNNGRRFSSEGFKIASVFIRKTELVPESNIDLSDDLRRMALREVEGGQLHSGRAFGRVAWNSLAIYPNVNFFLERLLEISEPRLGIFVSKDRDCLKAGLALPFMMSWAGQLATSTPHFTSVNLTNGSLEGDDFLSCFSAEMPLAPENKNERNI